MMKKLALVAALSTLYAHGETESYKSIANTMVLHANGEVRVNVLLREEDDEVACAAESYDFAFDINTVVGEKWYESLLLSRNTNSLVEFEYNSQDCTLLSLKLPQMYSQGDAVGEEPIDGKLNTSGEHGNVALIGTNGLTESSYYASNFYRQDVVTAAFDGHIFRKKVNQDAGQAIGRGIWIVEKTDSDGNDVNPWLEVDFGKEVELAGMRLLINQASLELGRSPRHIALLTSDDGSDYEEFDSFVLSAQSTVDVPFSSALNARYIRLQISSNYGDSRFIEIDEWELYQD